MDEGSFKSAPIADPSEADSGYDAGGAGNDSGARDPGGWNGITDGTGSDAEGGISDPDGTGSDAEGAGSDPDGTGNDAEGGGSDPDDIGAGATALGGTEAVGSGGIELLGGGRLILFISVGSAGVISSSSINRPPLGNAAPVPATSDHLAASIGLFN
jgi:hypothetical protein